MRAYIVKSPDELRELAPLAKSESTRRSINVFAAAWNGKLAKEPGSQIPFTITLGLSRDARLYSTDRNNVRKDFGKLYTNAARAFVDMHTAERG